jgi:hypothetical protein
MRVLLLDPERVAEGLERVQASGLVRRVPTPWQLSLGVLRMWHRIAFRSDTIGTSGSAPVRGSWRARLLHWRALRLPCLLVERAVAPWDLTGLLSDEARVVRHLLAAHHDGHQFVYDLQILACHPGALERVRDQARAVVEGSHPRTSWLRDLVVYEGYHESLLRSVQHALDGRFELAPEEVDDPDISFFGYLGWCAAQPATPREALDAWRRGALRFAMEAGHDA